MATTWGSSSGHLRVGIDCWTSTPTPSSTSVTVQLRVFVRVPDTWSFDDNQNYSISGPGGGSGTFYNNLKGAGATKLIYSTSFSRAIDYGGGPTLSWTASISGMYNGGTPSHSRSLTLPARPRGTPDAPTLSSSQIDPTADHAWWTVPAANGSALTGYQMHYARNSSFNPIEQDIVSDEWETSRVVDGLAKGSLYYKRIRARNSYGYGPWSAVRTFTTGTTEPGAPGQPSAYGIGATSATLSWSPPTDTGGTPITGYVVERATSPAFDDAVVATPTGTSLQVTGLAKGTTYRVRVKAVNAVGESDYSPVALFETDITPPGAPGAPTVSDIAPTTATLSWSAPSDAGGSSITGYEVQRSTSPAFIGAVIVAAEDSPANLSGLLPGTTHYVRVRAVNEAGAGAWSPATSFLTLSGVKVGNGSQWRDAIVWVGDGSKWVVAQVKVGDGSDWK